MSQFSLLIRHANVLLPTGKLVHTNVKIRGGAIARVGDNDDSDVDSTNSSIDATELTLLPELIDSQVHVWELGLEHKEDLFTASRACVRGGVTSYLEMPNTRQFTTTQEALGDHGGWTGCYDHSKIDTPVRGKACDFMPPRALYQPSWLAIIQPNTHSI
jgi:dihydroorotase